MFWLGRSRGSSPSFYGDEEEEEEEEAENKESKGSTRALTEALTEAETRPAERRVSTPAIRIQSDGISGEGREGGGGRGGVQVAGQATIQAGRIRMERILKGNVGCEKRA